MKKFICVRGWKRNSTGEVIEEWEYNKLPDEVKSRNFKEVVNSEPVDYQRFVKPVVEQPVVESVVETKEVKPVKSEAKKPFKPFSLTDLDVKTEEV